MTDPARVRRHAERIRELVASVVRTQIKDPRLGMLTITAARITADLRRLGGDRGDPDLRAAMQVQRPDLGGGHLEPAQRGDDRPHVGTLGLQ